MYKCYLLGLVSFLFYLCLAVGFTAYLFYFILFILLINVFFTSVLCDLQLI